MSQPVGKVAVTDFPSSTPNREPEDHMSVHHLTPRRHPEGTRPPIIEDEGADDGFDPDVDDLDETLKRFGSVGPANRRAHCVINASVLAAVTGYPTFVCEEFHHALFTLLGDVGDFDGLLATPLVCVGRSDRLEAARQWLAAHPPVDVDAMLAARPIGRPTTTCGRESTPRSTPTPSHWPRQRAATRPSRSARSMRSAT